MIAPALAQKIVERSMKVLPLNVNVMNARGIIIASGTPHRIGDLHAGAQMVLIRGETVEIGHEASSGLPGVKAGINLPLHHQGKICGVIGLTGDPKKIRQFGELVRITAEMIIEQAELTDELRREQRYREEFVFQLLKRSTISPESMQAWAERLGINLSVTRVVIILHVGTEETSPDLQLPNLQQAQAALEERWKDLLTTIISPRELAILEPFDATGSQTDCLRRAHSRMTELSQIISRSIKAEFFLTSGIALSGLEGASASYQSAKTTFFISRERQVKTQITSFYAYSLPVLLADLEQGWKLDQFLRPLQKLSKNDPKAAVLRKTLAAWFTHNRHPTQTAQALHIHRNTLDYRLSKISEITGLNLDHLDDLLLLYIGLQLKSPQIH